jgi:hypothetical protein
MSLLAHYVRVSRKQTVFLDEKDQGRQSQDWAVKTYPAQLASACRRLWQGWLGAWSSAAPPLAWKASKVRPFVAHLLAPATSKRTARPPLSSRVISRQQVLGGVLRR